MVRSSRDYGHVIDDCKDLRDGIEGLIRRGYFKQYQVQSKRERPLGEDDGKRRSVKERLTEIHVISGGMVHGGNIHGAKASLEEIQHQVNYHNIRKWPAPP